MEDGDELSPLILKQDALLYGGRFFVSIYSAYDLFNRISKASYISDIFFDLFFDTMKDEKMMLSTARDI